MTSGSLKRIRDVGDWVATIDHQTEHVINSRVDFIYVAHFLHRRCRIVQAELDRAMQCQNPFMSTKVLHGVDQRFAIAVLRRDLERELNRLLVLQVTEREKALEKYADIDAEIALIKRNEEMRALEEGYASSEDSDEESVIARARKGKPNRKQKKGAKIGHGYNIGNLQKEKGSARRQRMLAEKSKLGPGSCLACQCTPCIWKNTTDIPKIQDRCTELRDEINLVKQQDTAIRRLNSKVPLSVKRGGVQTFLREDLLYELDWELQILRAKLHAVDVDKELHDAYNTVDDYISELKPA